MLVRPDWLQQLGSVRRLGSKLDRVLRTIKRLLRILPTDLPGPIWMLEDGSTRRGSINSSVYYL